MEMKKQRNLNGIPMVSHAGPLRNDETSILGVFLALQ